MDVMLCISGEASHNKQKRKQQNSSSGSSTLSTSSIRAIVEKLKLQRVRDTTKQNYYSVWKTFNKFFLQLDIKPEAWRDRLVLFIGFLIEHKQVKSQTVKSYTSAMKNVLLDDGIELCYDTFLLSSLVKACKLKNDFVTARLPIQKSLLNELINFTESYFLNQGQVYLAILYKAIFMTSYFRLLRVSEVAATPSMHAIGVTDVQLEVNKKKILIIIRSSKTHGKCNIPQLVKISTKEYQKRLQVKRHYICPYTAIGEYIAQRPDYRERSEQFFVFKDHSPVTALYMRSTLHLMLKLMGYNEMLYNCQSFRIGRSCDLLKYGVPVENIKKLGRWSSNAVFNYL